MSDWLWMLLGGVLLVIAVCFLWATFFGLGGHRKNRRRPDSGRLAGEPVSAAVPPRAVAEPALGSVDIASDGTGHKAVQSPPVSNGDGPLQAEFSFDESSAGESAQSPQATAEPSEILLINVCARQGEVFSGKAIKAALSELGMVFGEMNIYHHFGIGESVQTLPVFSLANMLEPGAFDEGAMDSLATTGLVMFMRVPAPMDEKPAFELMLHTADRLAEILTGELRDGEHQLLDGGGIETLRRKLQRPHGAD